MAYTAANGIPTIEGTHEWVPFTGTAPPVINDQGAGASATPPGPTLPWTKLLGAPGIRRGPDFDDARGKRTLAEGEYPYPSLPVGKTVVMTCQVRALTLESVTETYTSFLTGFTENMDDDGTMTSTPYDFIGGVVWTWTARCIAFDPDESWSHFPKRRAPFRWGFSVSLRMSTARFYTDDVGYR